MNVRRIIIVILAILLLVTIVSKYTNKPVDTPPSESPQLLEKAVLFNPSGPTVIPVAGLTNSEISGDLDIEVTYWNNVDEVLAAVNKKETGLVVMPITAGVNMYNRGLDLTLLGVHEWKVFYLIARSGVEFSNWTSMQGKDIYTPVGKGQTADILMRAGLKQSNLELGVDVNINYAPPQEIVALFKEGKVDFAALPEPFVTMAIQGDKGSIVLDFQKYWQELSGQNDRLPIAGLFASKEFLKNYPRETVRFLDAFNKSITWANENPDLAIEASAEILPVPAPVIKQALKRIDFYYVPASECKAEVTAFLSKIKELDDESIEKVPDAGFYVDVLH